jgi:hypothetical protein
MTQPDLFTPTPPVAPRPKSRVELVKALFEARPDEWIDANELMQVGGRFAWRTRVSDCRRRYGMQITNREITVAVEAEDGSIARVYVQSEYRYRPTARA